MQIIWVDSENGGDSGDGSRQSPYATIEKAVTVFVSGDQIRLLRGTYTPTDSVIISGSGSIFSEEMGGATIQPIKTTNHGACLAILSCERFAIYGINIIQAIDPTGNLYGIWAEDVENFLCYTASVSHFQIPSGSGIGIYGRAFSGRIERCTVEDMTCNEDLYGIKAEGEGLKVIDCPVSNLTAGGACRPIFRKWTKSKPAPPPTPPTPTITDWIEFQPGAATKEETNPPIDQGTVLGFPDDGLTRECGWVVPLPTAFISGSSHVLRFIFTTEAAAFSGIARLQFTIITANDLGLINTTGDIFRNVQLTVGNISYIDIDIGAIMDPTATLLGVTMGRVSGDPLDTLAENLAYVSGRSL